MRTRRNRFAAILLAVTAASPLAVSPQGSGRVDACGLTDWLYGRSAPGYSTYYAPAVDPLASSTTQLPITQAPVSAYRPASAYRPLLAPAAVSAPTNFWGTTGTAPTITSMRPAMSTVRSYDNPSVYTGMPAGYGSPVSGATMGNPLRGVSPATNFGASNLYPNNHFAAAANSYSAGYGSTALTLPAQNIAPPPAAPVGGLRRFFGSLFGTNYRTSTYNAPVTFYRPATSLNPITGTTVTTQRACTGFETMAQRTPISGLQPFGGLPAGAVPVGPPVPVGGPAACSTSGVGLTSAAGGYGLNGGGYGDVAQAGGLMPLSQPNYGASTSPLVPVSPNSNLSSQLQPAPSFGYDYAPLTQSPAGNSGYQAGDDFTPMDQPELNAPNDYGSRSVYDSSGSYGAGRQSEFRPPSETDDRAFSARKANETASEYRQRLEDELRRLDRETVEPRSESSGSYWTLPRDQDTSAMLPRRESDYGDTMARYRSLEALTPTSLNRSSSPSDSPAALAPSAGLKYQAEPIRGLESRSRKTPTTDANDRNRSLVAPPLAASQRPLASRSVEAREIGMVRYEEERLPAATRSSVRSRRPAPQPKPVQRDSSWKPVR